MKDKNVGVASVVFIAILLILTAPELFGGTGTKTVTSVVDNGGGSYTLTMASSAAVTVGDHFGARTGSATGPGGLWIVTGKPSATQVTVEDTLDEENGGTNFGVPIAGDAWYGTPTAMGRSRIPHLAKAYDAAIRRNAYLDGTIGGGGTGATTAAGARTALDVQQLDTQLTSVAGLSYTGNTLKVIRVNAGETAFELATVSGGGGGETLAQTLALGADGNAVDQTNLGSLTLASGELVSLNGTFVRTGSGSPESVVTAPIGSIYLRNTDGSTGTTLYIKESGSGNTGWVAVAPGSGNVVDTLAATLGAGADGNSVDQTNLGTLTLAANKNVVTSGTGDLTAGDDLSVGDDATVTDALTVNGSTALGNAAADNVTVRGTLTAGTDGVGTSGQVLTSGGAGADLTWETLSGNVVDTLAATLGAGADGNDVNITNLGDMTLASGSHLKFAADGTSDVGAAAAAVRAIYIDTGVDTTAGDAATINKTAGRFRKDASGNTFTLTNSFVSSTSIVFCQLASTMADWSSSNCSVAVVAGAGSVTFTFTSTPTGNADFNFIVINP